MSFISQTSRSLSASQKLLLFTQKRTYSARERIHRHAEPDKFKKHMLAACEPYFKKQYNLPEEVCKGIQVPQYELLPLEKILADELVEDINNNDFILFIQHLYTPFQSERVYKNTLIKSGGTVHPLSNPVYKETFRILKLDAVQSLFVTRNTLVTGKADDMPKCIAALKKMPQFLLLAGYVDKHLYNYNQLQKMSLVTKIDQCRANLVSILETPGIELSSNLERHGESIEGDDKQSDQ